jgi:integral membrane sensor domain MASE1
MTLPEDVPAARPGWTGVVVAVSTALAYALVGALALTLAGPPGYASPLYPSAGIALAAVLCFGRAALPGVLLGSLAVNMGLGLLRAQSGAALLALPLVIGLGAMLQAWAGAALIRRFQPGPVLLDSPREIAAYGLRCCSAAPSATNNGCRPG